MEISALQKKRYEYKPKLPASLAQDAAHIALKFGEPINTKLILQMLSFKLLPNTRLPSIGRD